MRRQFSEQKYRICEPEPKDGAFAATTNVPQTGSRTNGTAGGGAGALPCRPWAMPRIRRRIARATSQIRISFRTQPVMGLFLADVGVGRLHAVQRLLRGARFLRAGRDDEDLLPGLRRPLEILLAEGADDADVEQRFRVGGIDRQ